MAGPSNGRPTGNQQPAPPQTATQTTMDAPPKEDVEVSKEEKAERPDAKDALRARPDMSREDVENASPNHLLEPDPLPPLNRPIFDPPPSMVHLHTMPLHPNQPDPTVEGAVEELRLRLGEIREFLKRFPHEVGGELGSLVSHLRTMLHVPKPNAQRDAARRAEDEGIRARRHAEDAGMPPTAARLQRRSEEDAGMATARRVQDSSS